MRSGAGRERFRVWIILQLFRRLAGGGAAAARPGSDGFRIHGFGEERFAASCRSLRGLRWGPLPLFLLLFLAFGDARANVLTATADPQTPANQVFAGVPVSYALHLTNTFDSGQPATTPDTIGISIGVTVNGRLVNARENNKEFTVTGCSNYDPQFPQYFICPNLVGVGATQAPVFTWNRALAGNNAVSFRIFWRRLPQAGPPQPDGIIDLPAFTTQVSDLNPAGRLAPLQVVGSDFKFCALLSNGMVKCWGSNGFGQLGLGDPDFNNNRGDGPNEMGNHLPAVALFAPTDGRRVVQLAGGNAHTCARFDDGSVKCWGRNRDGQLGLGDTVDRGGDQSQMGENLPAVQLGASRTAVELVAGSNHTCARLDDGSVKCWGNNTNGELGQNDDHALAPALGDEPNEMGDFLLPVNLGVGRTAVELSTNGAHTCARLDDGSVKCWGLNDNGQLGQGDTNNRGDQPGEMSALPPIELGSGRRGVQLAAGHLHTCARLDDGSVKCWGDGGSLSSGDGLGLESTDNRGDAPGEMGDNLPAVNLGAGLSAVELAAGTHTCARLDDGTVKCWGNNIAGQLGLGDTNRRGDVPGEMGDLLPRVDLGTELSAVELTASDTSTCTRLDDGSLKCWGGNYDGELGLGDTNARGDQPGEMGANLPVVDLGGPLTATLQATDASASEVGPDPGTFTVSLDVPAPQDLAIGYAVAGTAAPGVDYQALSGSVTIPAGQTSAPITVTPVTDTRFEGPETVALSLEPGTDYQIGAAGSAVIDIADAPPPPADFIVDQANGGVLTSQGFTGSSAPVGQEFVPAANSLNVLELYLNDQTNGDGTGISAFVNIRQGTITGPILGTSETVAFPDPGPSVVSPAFLSRFQFAQPVALTPGQVYVIEVVNTSQGDIGIFGSGFGTDGYPAGNSYSQGALYSGTPTAPAPFDLWFRAGNTGLQPEAGFAPENLSMAEGSSTQPTVQLDVIGAGSPGVQSLYSSYQAQGFTVTRATYVVDLAFGGTAAPGTDFGFGGSGQTVSGNTVTYVDNSASANLGGFGIPFSANLDGVTEGVETVTAQVVSGRIDFDLVDQNGIPAQDSVVLSPRPQSVATISITDTAMPTVTIVASDPDASEVGPDSGQFLVTLDSPASPGGVTILYQTGGTATNGQDYQTLSGALFIPEGTTAGILPVTPTADSQIEGPELAIVLLVPGTGYQVGLPNSATLTIADTPLPTATLQATDANASEVGPDTGQFLVTLDSPAPAAGVTVNYQTSGTATNGQDYQALNGNVSIPAGQISATILLTPILDHLTEGSETVVVTLGSGAGYQVGSSASGTVTIADAPPLASIQAPAADAAEDAPDTRRFMVYLDRPAPPRGITVNYAFGGTAGDGVDYIANPHGSVTIPENQTRAYIELTPIADDLVEGQETVELRVQPGTGYNMGDLPSASLAIADRTLPGESWKVLQIVGGEQNGDSGKDQVCALLSNGTVKCWGVNSRGQLGLGDTIDRGGHTGEMGNNLPAVDLGSGRRAVELTGGNASICATLENGDLKCWGDNSHGQLGQGDNSGHKIFIGDEAGEMGDDLHAVNLGAGRKAIQVAMGSNHTCALLDDGSAKCWGWNGNGQLGLGDLDDRHIPDGKVEFGSALEAVELAAMMESTCARLNDGSLGCWGKNELGIGQLGLEDTIQRPAPDGAVNLGTGQRARKLSALQHGICVQLVSGGIKCWGENNSGALGQGDTINRGYRPGQMGDNLPVVQLGTNLEVQQFTARVYHACVLFTDRRVKCWGNNDEGQLGLGDIQDRGNEPGEMGDALPFVDLGQDASVRELTAGSWISCARFENGRVKCWGNNKYGQLGLEDNALEDPTAHRGDAPDEMGNALPYIDLGGPAVILPGVAIQATDPDAAELGPDTGQFTVTLSIPAATDITVNYTVEGMATNGVDYQPLSGVVTIPAGQISATITVTPIPDTLLEGPETVTVTLAQGTGYSVDQPASATVTIADAPLVATVQATDPNAGEVGPGAGEFMISLGSPVPASGPAVQVAYSVAGTAANGVDYQGLSGVVTIQPGQDSASIPVLPIPDTLVEGLETVTVTFQPGTREESSATVTITDTPPPLLSVAANVVRAAEKGRKSGAFTFTLTQPAPAEGMTLAYSVGGTATAGNDYVPLPGTLSIPPGDTTVRLSVRVKNDAAKEGPESVVLTLLPAAGYQLGTPLTATVTIEDDDAKRPPPNDCEANQLEEAVKLNREFAACTRTNLRTHDDPAYLACKAGAKSAFASRYDRVMATLTGCQFTLPGSEVADLWGDQIGTVTDPLVSAWHVPPSGDFRPAARSRRFITVSKVAERSVKNALKAEIRYLRDGGKGLRLAARAGVRTELARRIRNLASERPDYTGPGARQYVSRVDQSVDNLVSDVTAPTRLTPIQVALGSGFGCARFNDLTVKCWGDNETGQLGLGDTLARGDQANEMADNLPVVALGTGRRALELAVGDRHVCARLNDGSVKCWGDGSAGQLGLGDMAARGDQAGEMGDNLPAVDLGAGRIAVAIRAGAAHTCALLDNGAVKCWGSNGNGELGLGDTSHRGDQPGEMGDWLPTVDFGPGRWAVELTAGSTHTCARLDDGSVRCWGQNLHGALGLGDTENRGERPGEMGAALPVVDLGAGGIAELAAGGHFTCARFESGRVACWGRNDSGQLGLGDTADRGDQPGEMGAALAVVDLGTGRGALGLALGFGHACARLDDESLKCWGFNASGQLGLGDNLSRGIQPGQMGDALAPTDLGTGRRVAEVAAGRSHTCARLDNATVKCWGSNSDGALGLGDTTDRGIQAGQMGDSLPAVQLGQSATTTP